MPITQTVLTNGSIGAGNTSASTASITPGANRLILVAVQNSSFGTPGTISLSGNGLTYVEEETLTFGAGTVRLSVFRAMGSSPSTGAISITNLSNNGAQWAVIEFDGVDTTGTNGSGAIVQSVSNSTTGGDPNSLTVTLAALADAVNNAVFAAFGVGSDALQTHGTGYTELTDDNSLGGSESIGLETQWKLPGTTTPNASGQPAFADIAGIGIEIKAAAGGTTHEVALSLGVSLAQTNTTAAAFLSSLTLAIQQAISTAGGVVIETALALDLDLGVSSQVQRDIAASLTLVEQLGVSSSVSAELGASLALTQNLTLALVAQAAKDAGISLASSLSIQTNGTTAVVSIVTPDSRIYTVTLESRTLTVQAEDRVITIPAPDKTLTIQ